MKSQRLLASILCVLLFGGCQTLRPTEVHERNARRVQGVKAGEAEAIPMDEKTVVLDARQSFDYSMAHVPGSVSVQWDHYTQPEEDAQGILQKDLFAIARRLARMGVSPESQVVVVGKGVHGSGEEGRVAWMLAYLGVKNVRFADVDYFKAKLTNLETKAVKNASMWKPKPDSSLLVTRKELLKVINGGGTYRQSDYAIFDVRGEREYLNKEGIGIRVAVPDIGAINIEWREFLTNDGRPNPEIARKLLSIGIRRDQRIIVISNQGVRSAAVTMALHQLGFTAAGNYSGGLIDLTSSYSSK